MPARSVGGLPPRAATPSIWWDESVWRGGHGLPPPAKCTLPSSTDVVIVGGGIAGLLTGLYLAGRRVDTVLLEAQRIGAGATSRNAGFLLAESECFALTAEHSGVEAATFLRDTGIRSRELIRELLDGRERWAGLKFPGSVRLASDDGEAAAFTESAAHCDALRALPVHRVAERGTGDAYQAALLDPDDGVLHPLRMLSVAREHAVAAGLTICEGVALQELSPRRGGVTVTTTAGNIRARRVVLATSSAARLYAPAARPIRPVRAQALAAIVDPAPKWRRPIYATRGGDYWRPLGDNRVLLGGLRRLNRRAESTRDSDPTPELQRALDRFLRELVGPVATIEVTHRWAGIMAFTPDWLPWCGALPGSPRVHVLSGLVGHGMGWAPALAESLAESLTGGPKPPRLVRPRPR